MKVISHLENPDPDPDPDPDLDSDPDLGLDPDLDPDAAIPFTASNSLKIEVIR